VFDGLTVAEWRQTTEGAADIEGASAVSNTLAEERRRAVALDMKTML
jgi:hypothetical protein